MKIVSRTVPILVALILAVQAFSAPIASIRFDPLQPGEDALNFFNGGLGSLGSGPGPTLGVVFGPGWIATPGDPYGSPQGKSASITGSAYVNAPSGFSGPTGFYCAGGPLTVNFFDGLSGGGNLVSTLTIPACNGGFSGLAGFTPAGAAEPFYRSAVFTGSDRIATLTFGALPLPEAGTLTLTLLGLGILVVRRCSRPA